MLLFHPKQHLLVVPRVLRQHWTGFFLIQCCLDPLRQHWIGLFWPVQCWPKGIKKIMLRISYAMLSEASQTTLDRVLPVRCCPPKSIRWHRTGFFLIQCCLEHFRHCIFKNLIATNVKELDENRFASNGIIICFVVARPLFWLNLLFLKMFSFRQKRQY